MTVGQRLLWAMWGLPRMEHDRSAGPGSNKVRHFSQIKLAAATGVHRSTVQAYVNDETSPPVAWLVRAAEVLGVRPEWLLAESGEPTATAQSLREQQLVVGLRIARTLRRALGEPLPAPRAVVVRRLRKQNASGTRVRGLRDVSVVPVPEPLSFSYAAPWADAVAFAARRIFDAVAISESNHGRRPVPYQEVERRVIAKIAKSWRRLHPTWSNDDTTCAERDYHVLRMVVDLLAKLPGVQKVGGSAPTDQTPVAKILGITRGAASSPTRNFASRRRRS